MPSELTGPAMFLLSLTAGLGSWLVWKWGRRLVGGAGRLGADAWGSEAEADSLVELERLRIAERREIREQYERLAREKLDVLRTAVAMGYDQRELAELDARLEQHIGHDGLRELLAGNDGPVLRGSRTSVL
jgi:hypothetical protein